ncbi:hypothetical protein A6R68_24167, partial [Neotoma lepida]
GEEDNEKRQRLVRRKQQAAQGEQIEYLGDSENSGAIADPKALVSKRMGRNGATKRYAGTEAVETKLKNGGYSSVKRWTNTINIFTKDQVLVPVHLDIHWSIVVIDVPKKTIIYWDSMGQKRPDILGMIFQYLQDESKARRNKYLNPSDWSQYSMTAEEIPRQLSG